MAQQQQKPSSEEDTWTADDMQERFTAYGREQHLFTVQMQRGRLYPLHLPVHAMQRVLHLGCSTGEWLFDLAHLHSHLQCYGMETDEHLLREAIIRRNIGGMHRIELRKMTHWHALSAPDNYFDLIFTRYRTRSVSPHLWPQIIQECMRLLRPGGWLVIVDVDYFETSSPAFMALHHAAMQAMKYFQNSIDATGSSFGVTLQFYQMFQAAGLQEVRYDLDSLDFGFMSGSMGHHFMNNIMQYEQFVRPLVIQAHVLYAGEFDALVAQANVEMRARDFCGWGMLISTYGQKPAQ